MSAFNLRDVVNDVLDETPLNAPGDIAPLVLARIPAAEREHALLALLPGFVGGVMGARLRSEVERDDEPAPAPAPRVGPSRFVGLRDHLLAERVRGADGYKAFGECVAADLLAMIDFREGQSRGNLAWAAKYRRILDAMLERDAQTVADLGADQVRDLMSPSAVKA